MNKVTRKPAVLIICDGWGQSDEAEGNAILGANPIKFEELKLRWPNTLADASGKAFGLPEGQIGSSEVGHMTIGGGRIKLQPLSRQIDEVETGKFENNQVLLDAIQHAKEHGSRLHIAGLLSPGGVHSYDGSAYELIRVAHKLGVEHIYLHAFSDGRDVAPRSFKSYLEEVALPRLDEIGAGRIVSVSGRYYSMDRDNRWDRTELAYDLLTADDFVTADNIIDYVAESYQEDTRDEFMKPVRIAGTNGEQVRIESGDTVIFFNFRPDRVRQLSHALVDRNFASFDRKQIPEDLYFVSFTEYDSELSARVAFPEEPMRNSLGEVVANAGLRQFHIAETEKYAHITYFLNGGIEEPFEGEDRKIIPSPKVATYDLAPKMSASSVKGEAIEAIRSGKYGLVAINFANADMVGHTGVYEATVEAVKELDECIFEVVEATLDVGGFALMTADHGNAEVMKTPEGEAVTAHTTNKVPVLICGIEGLALRSDGGLRDIAPTVLDLMGIDQPSEMSGRSLVE